MSAGLLDTSVVIDWDDPVVNADDFAGLGDLVQVIAV